MAITKVSRGLLSTGVSDSSDATAITIDSSENVTLAGTLDVSGEVDITATDDLRLRFYDGGTFKAGLQVATSANDMISGSADGDLAIRAQGNMVFSSGGNLMQQALDTNGQFTLYGYNAANGFAVPQDQSTGYTNNLNAGTFGVLHRANYDSYITSNAYYYKTGGTAGWKAKYPAYKSGVISMLDGRFVFGCSSAAPGGSGVVAVDGLQDRVRIDSDGLKFGTDTAAANALDDYEEGTWTPTFVNFGTGTYTHQLGIYTKIGNLVTVQCHLDVGSPGNASGAVQVSGLPFAALNSSNMYGVSSSIHGTSWNTQRTSLNLLVSPNGTSTTALYYGMCIAGAVTASHADLGSGNLLFSVTYRTT